MCNGKYIEYRTRKSYIELECNLASCVSRFLPGNSDNSSAHVLKVCHSPIAEGSSRSKEKVEQEESTPFDDNYESDFDVFVPSKRWRLDQFREPEVIQHENSDNNESNNEYEDEDESEEVVEKKENLKKETIKQNLREDIRNFEKIFENC